MSYGDPTVFDLRNGTGGAFNPATDDAQILVTRFVHDVTTGLRVGVPDTWWTQYAYSPAQTAAKTLIFYPIAGTELERYNGRVNRDGGGGVKSKTYTVETMAKGSFANMRLLRQGDVKGFWSNAPAALTSASNKHLGRMLGRIWADAYADNSSVLDSWGQKWLSSSADRANNPFKDYGVHKNLTYSQAFTQENIMAACARIRLRKGTDGKYLGLKPKYLLVPQNLDQEADLILNKRVIVPVAGGSNDVGATADAYNYLEKTTSLELPEYAWGIIADTAQLGLSEQELPFVTIYGIGSVLGNKYFSVAQAGAGQMPMGGTGNTIEAGAVTPNSGIPPIEVRWWGADSALYEETENVAVDLYNTTAIHAQDGRWFEMCSTDGAP